MIAGITIGGFIVLLALIGLIFYITKDHTQRKKKKDTLPSTSSTSTNFELTSLSIS
jgi:preprotein translocase subunit YajC